MSLFFFLNNLHFGIEILGALAFGVAGWLAFDAFVVRRDFLTMSRGLGFLFLAASYIFRALELSSDLVTYAAFILAILGVGLLIWNLLLERPASRPEFKVIVLIPSAGALLVYLNAAMGLGFFIIGFLAFRQYRIEMKKAIFLYALSFFLLSAGSFAGMAYDLESPDLLWAIGHVLELGGFLAVGWWVWGYLQLRIREEILLILTTTTLTMAIVVTLAFSSVLFYRIESAMQSELRAHAKVTGLLIGQLRSEALAKARLLALRPDIADAVLQSDFAKLEELGGSLLKSEDLGFITIVDNEGYVMSRAHALSAKDENLSGEAAIQKALGGVPSVVIESRSPEAFSIRAAAPIMKDGKRAGAVSAGFFLDNAFVDRIKRLSGLDASILEEDRFAATTVVNADNATRSVGVRLGDPVPKKEVFEGGGDVSIRIVIASRPYLASFIPLKDGERTVGMVSVAKAQREILAATNVTNRLTLLATVALMLILVIPMYRTMKRLGAEVA